MRQVNPRLADNDAELRAAYGEYRDGATGRQLLHFFDAHKSEDWFIEKYYPDNLSMRKSAILEARKAQYSVFIEDLQAGKYDNIDLDVKDGTEENVDGDQNGVAGGNILYLKTIPPSLTRVKIEEVGMLAAQAVSDS